VTPARGHTASVAGKVGLLAAVLLICIPPALVSLDRSDATFHMEVLAVGSSHFTWLRQCAGDRDAWRVPDWNGEPRIHKPPLVVWINMLSWSGLSPATATADQQVLRARLAALGAAALALAATFWAGITLGGDKLAFASALVTGTMMLFIRQARVASYDTYLLAFSTLSVAAGLRAIYRPRGRTSLFTSALCWVISGVALGAAILSKGPLALIFVAGPLLLMTALVKDRRTGNTLGVIAALSLAAALAAPWYVYIFEHVPGALGRITREYQAARQEFQPPWYYFGLVTLVFPWTLWLVGSLWSSVTDRESGDALPRHLILAWLAWIFIVMSIPGAKQQRYIVPILPAAGLLVARFLTAWDDSSRVPLWLPRFHGVLLVLGGVAFVALGLRQETLIDAAILHRPVIAGIAPSIALFFGVGLIGIGVAAHLAYRAGSTGGILLCTALWMSIAGTVGFYGNVRTPKGAYRHRAEAEKVREIAGGLPVWHLRLPDGEKFDEEPDEKFLFYFRRPAPAAAPDELRARLHSGQPHFVIARDDEAHRRLVAELGYKVERQFNCGRRPRVLCSSTP
jgi:4-amino-4-deoxy-L-arabinose transferase-like glycosyltransferase